MLVKGAGAGERLLISDNSCIVMTRIRRLLTITGLAASLGALGVFGTAEQAYRACLEAEAARVLDANHDGVTSPSEWQPLYTFLEIPYELGRPARLPTTRELSLFLAEHEVDLAALRHERLLYRLAD